MIVHPDCILNGVFFQEFQWMMGWEPLYRHSYIYTNSPTVAVMRAYGNTQRVIVHPVMFTSCFGFVSSDSVGNCL